MKHIGIICEYNPFHAGHAYLLQKAHDAGDTAVCVMSGNFTQRGEAAILPPLCRAEMALCGGADLVVELPFPYAASSAEHFARAGVRALAGLGADAVMFGSECGDVGKLTRAAERLLAPECQEVLAAEGKKRGVVRVLFEYLGEEFSSNDLLGISYIKAILEEQLPLEVLAVPRVGAGYLDTDAEQVYPSATALRQKLIISGGISENLPSEVRTVFERGVADYGLAQTVRLGGAALAFLRGDGVRKATCSEIAECDAGLLARLVNAAWDATDYDTLLAATANKSYTDGRLRRALLMLLSGVTRGELAAAPAYLRVLGANERGRQFLSSTRKTRTIPALNKDVYAKRYGVRALRQQELARISDGLYALCFPGDVTPREVHLGK